MYHLKTLRNLTKLLLEILNKSNHVEKKRKDVYCKITLEKILVRWDVKGWSGFDWTGEQSNKRFLAF